MHQVEQGTQGCISQPAPLFGFVSHHSSLMAFLFLFDHATKKNLQTD